MEARKMLTNASYFAFTATPKNKTLEMFGVPLPPNAEGKIKHRPFHSYTMKQAIQEGFILDVLKCYTPVDSYYKLVKKIESDPEFDTRRAAKKLRKYVESHDHAIAMKAEIMVDHFHEQVMALNKIGGQARAMVVCSGIERAIQYYCAFKEYLAARKSPYKAIVAFSGEPEHQGGVVTESSLNGFPGTDIAEKIQEDPYRFLICADKFQTGYDEPLLHTMYVDKPLSGIKAVQTLSRLNRAHPQKHDVFVLDFLNSTEVITEAFADYYRTTVLSEETDPNKLHDLKAALDSHQVYAPEQIENLVALYLAGAEREKLDPILDACVATYLAQLDEDGQVDFKGKAKAFTRTYDFLASILPYTNAAWEKLSIFLNFLVPKLPAPVEEDLAKGILESIDMDSYRIEKRAAVKVLLPDENAEIEPIPVSGGGKKAEPELDRLSNILKTFNGQFGTLFSDADRVVRRITQDIAPKVAADQPYQNAMKNTPNAARIELDAALIGEADRGGTVGILEKLCGRFHLVAGGFLPRRENRHTISIKDEYDVQDVLRGLLRLFFEDVRPEDVAPQFAGGRTRIDFVLPDEKTVIEAKMTRKGLGDREIGDELGKDILRYRTHPSARTLVCFVYDPDRRIKNPRGIEKDLMELSDQHIRVVVFIRPV